jgi:hypothetical protein
MAIDYLQKILTAKVYDVAIESPLDLASSTRTPWTNCTELAIYRTPG